MSNRVSKQGKRGKDKTKRKAVAFADRKGERCSAKTKSTGKQCNGFAIKGAKTCRMHGSSTSEARQAAKRRLEVKKIAEQVYKEVVEEGGISSLGNLAGVDKHPIQHLLDELYLSANVVQVLTRQVELLDSISQEDWSGVQHKHIIYDIWYNERQVHARLAKMCLDAGVQERQIQVMETQAELLSNVLHSTLTELGLDMNDPKIGSIVRKNLMELEAS